MSNWIRHLTDLLSGRVFNTLVALNSAIRAQEIKMTRNEELIMNAAHAINAAAQSINTRVDALVDRIAQLEGIEQEDLSQEIDALNEAVASLGSIGTALTPSEPVTEQPVEDTGVVVAPIEHDPNPVPQGQSGDAQPVPAEEETLPAPPVEEEEEGPAALPAPPVETLEEEEPVGDPPVEEEAEEGPAEPTEDEDEDGDSDEDEDDEAPVPDGHDEDFD